MGGQGSENTYPQVRAPSANRHQPKVTGNRPSTDPETPQRPVPVVHGAADGRGSVWRALDWTIRLRGSGCGSERRDVSPAFRAALIAGLT
jgi:hypothetical protein